MRAQVKLLTPGIAMSFVHIYLQWQKGMILMTCGNSPYTSIFIQGCNSLPYLHVIFALIDGASIERLKVYCTAQRSACFIFALIDGASSECLKVCCTAQRSACFIVALIDGVSIERLKVYCTAQRSACFIFVLIDGASSERLKVYCTARRVSMGKFTGLNSGMGTCALTPQVAVCFHRYINQHMSVHNVVILQSMVHNQYPFRYRYSLSFVKLYLIDLPKWEEDSRLKTINVNCWLR